MTCQNRKWLNMSRPHFTCLLTRFWLLQELGEAYSLQDINLLWLLFSPLYLLHLNYCSFIRETAVFQDYAKRFSAAQESCVHAIAFRITPIDSPDCDTKPTYHGILRWCLLEVMCLLLRFQALPSSVLAVTCRNRSRTRESHYNTLKLQSIHNWSMALAGVQRSYNFSGKDMSRTTARPWFFGWMSHDHTCTSGDHRLPVTCQSHNTMIIP